MIQITLDSNAAAIVQRLQAWPAGMLQAVAGAVDKQNQTTIGVISYRYMSRRSATTLGVVTNRLRSSLTAMPAQVKDQSVITAIGSNVKYAGIHEFGFQGKVTVRAHTRRLFGTKASGGLKQTDETAIFDTKTGQIKRIKKKVRYVTDQVQVREHQMKMNMPARPYIQRGIADTAADYSAAVSQAIIGSWRNGGQS